MKRKLVKRNKEKLSFLLQKAARNDMSLPMLIEVMKRYNDTKRSNRLEKKHGVYHDWNLLEYDEDWLVVPICSKKTDEIFSYQIFVEKNQLPPNKQYLFKEENTLLIKDNDESLLKTNL